MRLFFALSAVMILAQLPAAAQAAAPQELEDAIFDDVKLYRPADKPAKVIVLLSDADGFGNDEETLAAEFQQRGDLVIGLDWPTTRRTAGGRHRMTCPELAGHIEDTTLRIEREQAITPYVTPVLAGAGLGRDAARSLALQADSHRLAGVIAVHTTTMKPDTISACLVDKAALASADVSAATTASFVALREIEDGDESAAEEAAEALGKDAGPHGPGDLSDLPLYVSEPEQPASRLAVVLTGDGGMGQLNVDLATALTRRGVGVVSIDSRRYFWAKRDPDEVAADLKRIIKHYRAAWPVERVALVGYSFGGDALPLVYNRLSKRIKSIVAVVSLLSIAPVTDMRVELSDDDYPNEIPLLPEAARIDAPNVQCIYGQDDRMAALACPALAKARPDFAILREAGGHGFSGDAERLADLIVAPLLSAPAVERHARAGVSGNHGH
ncbi:AcvB/VirJ family lysyl-phosphatidylglycerol hydrolase [Labrys sp. KB_33_2]|uniref:AcvB/VirJ family lysyl-phosphatidylglycerol hydrolase n=1 Tax=Labrys sp. KB_33_2 TaxID=3237479 RepID=UPI003F8F79F3